LVAGIHLLGRFITASNLNHFGEEKLIFREQRNILWKNKLSCSISV